MNFKTTVEREKEATTKRFFEQFTSDGEIFVDEDGTLTPWISHFIEQEVEKAMNNAALAVVRDIEQKLYQDKSYYNPIGDERNIGRHALADALLKELETLKASLTTSK